MDTQEIPLIVLLLKAETPERHEYHAVLSTIQAYTFRLRDVFQDEETRDDILLHVDRVLPRLQRVFETMKSISLHGDVPENLFQGIVSPLLDPEIGILSLDQAFHLAGAALPVLLNKPSPSPYLHYVADMVLGFEGLLEMLIAHGAYSTALLDWLSSKRNFLGDLHVLTITQTLFHMCDICPADHSITATSEKWHNARSLMDSLKSLVASIQKDEKENMEPARNLPLSNMKPLSRDDKKKGRPRRDTGPTFQIPDDILQKMTMLNLPKPGSRHALSIALEVLEKEIPSFMQAALETFPCRFCWERLTGTLTTQAHPSTASGWTVNANTNYDIFGRRVGLWKVLLSDRALKSSRKLARTGMCQDLY